MISDFCNINFVILTFVTLNIINLYVDLDAVLLFKYFKFSFIGRSFFPSVDEE